MFPFNLKMHYMKIFKIKTKNNDYVLKAVNGNNNTIFKMSMKTIFFHANIKKRKKTLKKICLI